MKTNAEFQEEVKVALAKLVTRREDGAALARSTAATFQDAVFEFVNQDAQRRGDVAEDTSDRTGLIKNCKVGDAVITLGPDCAAAGARIVVEAKEEARVHAADGPGRNRAGPQEPRRPAGRVRVLAAHGAGDRAAGALRLPTCSSCGTPRTRQTDAFLRGGLEIEPRPVPAAHAAADRQKIDFTPIDRAILDIEKRVQNLDQVRNFGRDDQELQRENLGPRADRSQSAR